MPLETLGGGGEK
jgi:hypothetical protein